MRGELISFTKALRQTLDSIVPLGPETVALLDLVNRTAAGDLLALVDTPESDVSLKDGYAVHSADIATARADAPVRLRVTGEVAAGGRFEGVVAPGCAVRIWSGAAIPAGADAVLSEEFARPSEDGVVATADAEPGRNVLPRGTDTRAGQRLFPAGTLLTRPAQIGLLAAAGYSRVDVVRQPRVALVATGDEIVVPGRELGKGKVFASNLVTLASWCSLQGFGSDVWVVEDDPGAIRSCLLEASAGHDAIVTSGGAWRGERDLVVGSLDELGWEKGYHEVRIGPGKAVGFGMWQGKPVFCLPGGPPSNQMAFLQLAVPALQKLAGRSRPGLAQVEAKLTESVFGQEDWTQFLEGRIEVADGCVLFTPTKLKSRLQALASVEAILSIPEGSSRIPAGATVRVQLAPGYRLP